jgi:peroxiredoxin Q/BCP
MSLKINDKAPNFTAKALIKGKEKEIKLTDFKGKKIVIYFYPKDLTPGCTVQACNLRDNYSELEKNNITIIGVSKDSIKSHSNFITKKELPFILVSDENLEINKAYGVWEKKKFMGKEYMGTKRKTFLIDENLKIGNIINKPNVKNHTQEILEGFNIK